MSEREIKQLVVHCAATRPSLDVGVAEIRAWHRQQGWSDVGYHHVIRRDGTVEPGRREELVGAHVSGHNRDSIGICLVGGLDAEGEPAPTFTEEQFAALRGLLNDLLAKYDLSDDAILGHRDFPGVSKACPCFDVRHWWKTNEVIA
jgi:N-acetyl-anhydromuramyl-L-alanine amidase AmpD